MSKYTRQFSHFLSPSRRKKFLITIPLVLMVAACARVDYQPEVLESQDVASRILSRNPDEPGFREFVEQYGYEIAEWPPEQWNFTLLTLAALYFNPDLQVARAKYDLRDAEEKTAGQRSNPQLNVPIEHHSDTSGNRSPWLAGLVSDLVFERRAKRDARISRAGALKEAARIGLAVESWGLRNRVLQKYIEYYSAVQTSLYIQQEYKLLSESMQLLESRLELGQVSSFTVSLARLELQQLGLEVSQQTARVDEAFYGLVNSLGLSVEAFGNKNMAFSVFNEKALKFDYSITDLRELALQNHLTIKKALVEYQAVEQALKYEIEKQYPDIRLSPGLIFDQSDKLWALGSAWILPLFHNNEGPIAEALARRKIKQAEFMSLQTTVLNDLGRFRTQFLDMKQVLEDSQLLIDDLEQQYHTIFYQYEQGYSDKLDTVRAELELTKARQKLFSIRIHVIRVMQELENAVQYPLFDNLNLTEALSNLFEMHNPRSSK